MSPTNCYLIASFRSSQCHGWAWQNRNINLTNQPTIMCVWKACGQYSYRKYWPESMFLRIGCKWFWLKGKNTNGLLFRNTAKCFPIFVCIWITLAKGVPNTISRSLMSSYQTGCNCSLHWQIKVLEMNNELLLLTNSDWSPCGMECVILTA